MVPYGVADASDVTTLAGLARQAARTGLMDELEVYAERALASTPVGQGAQPR